VKKPQKLSNDQLRVLLATSWDDLLGAFPGYNRRFLLAEKNRAKRVLPAAEVLRAEGGSRHSTRARIALERQVGALLDERERLGREMDALRRVLGARGHADIRIPETKKHEAAAVALASDWHWEEVVTSAECNGLNEYNKEIAELRCGAFFGNLAKLVTKEQRDVVIRNGVLWLGGDLLSGNIHEALVETNRLGPVPAAIEVQQHLAGGLRYLLDNTDLHWSIPCSVGNHERITAKTRIKTSTENSLAAFVYYGLAAQFANEKRLTFRLPDAYFTYLDIHGKVCRFHHGDAIRYLGGIGGLHIPLRRKIADWNKSRRADYDFLGHLHTFTDGGYYVVNGSQIGFSAYASYIAAAYERPQQAFCLIDSRYGKTGVFPILVEG